MESDLICQLRGYQLKRTLPRQAAESGTWIKVSYLRKHLPLARQGCPKSPPATPRARQKGPVHPPDEQASASSPCNLELSSSLFPHSKAMLKTVLHAVMGEALRDDAQHSQLILVDEPGVKGSCDRRVFPSKHLVLHPAIRAKSPCVCCPCSVNAPDAYHRHR